MYGLLAVFLVVYYSIYFVTHSEWNKERYYRQLMASSPEKKVPAAERLFELNGQSQLVRALKSNSGAVRQLALFELWKTWYHEAGDEAYQLTQATLTASKRKKYDLAFQVANRLLEKYPKFAEGWNRRAVLYWETGDYEKSISDCEKVVALNPNHFAAWEGMALCHFYLGELEEACRDLRIALRIHPHADDARLFLLQWEELLRKNPNRSTQPTDRA